ncbi:pentapeptide repeat-containing protein [Defluviitalea phaphyphila]|uniref:pentapeptide repeat-containing protein n=1 Tax=Defluviitalea phaphyphila TaxID=1473580 RepID=UPI00073038CC|nr:pentapeptide repeat-containing protein [Defluviitalea phaphyphila]
MNRKEALQHFYEKYGDKKNFEKILELDRFCKENIEFLTDKFCEAFKKLCNKIISLQQSGEKGKISFINFQILRTDILQKKYRILITAYDKNFYLDKKPVQVDFEMKEMFTYLNDLEEYLLKNYKQYVGKINVDDISVIIQMQVINYIRYIINISRIAIRKIKNLSYFTEIEKEEDFYISTGEYKDYSELIYFKTKQNTNIEEIRDSINGKKKGNFHFNSYTDLDLSDLDLRNINFCFSDFTNSKLSRSDMRVSYFICTDFSNCKMDFVNLNYSILHDANFENCNLYGADLIGIMGGLTEPKEDMFYSPGFSGINFAGANLSEVDFSNGDLSGADFRGAVFDNTNFTGTNLNKAIFEKESIDKLDLSKEQLRSIIIQ